MSLGKTKYNTKGRQQKAGKKKTLNDIKYYIDIYNVTYIYALGLEFKRTKDLDERIRKVVKDQQRFLNGFINGDYTVQDMIDKMKEEWGIDYESLFLSYKKENK